MPRSSPRLVRRSAKSPRSSAPGAQRCAGPYRLACARPGPRIDFPPLKQPSGKVITAFAVHADLMSPYEQRSSLAPLRSAHQSIPVRA